MSSFNISKNVSLPTELATRRSAIFGISGSGKSNTATVCIEKLLEAGEQVVLIDPKGEGWGLQTSADGKHAAFDIIVFGQPRGDIPDLREEHAQQLADFVVDSGRSVVLSLLGFDSDQAERRFVTTFFKTLYRRKSRQTPKTRTLVVLEEAHLFVPEQASGASGEMVGAIKRIARQGRSAGIGLMIVDQRPQEVAKSIISQSELLICHQLVHKLDRNALQDWIRAYDTEGQAEAFLESLASLAQGEAWVWSPAWLHLFVRTHVDRRKTYDSGATPDGSPAAAPKAKAAVDLDALRNHLAKVVDEAKANDPVQLKRRVAELERQLASRPKEQVEKTVEKLVEVPVLKNGQLDRTEKIADRLQAFADKFTAETAELRRLIAPAAAPRPAPVPTTRVAVGPRVTMTVPTRLMKQSSCATATENGTAEVGRGGLRRILIALAQRPGLTNRQIGVRAGLSSGSGSFGTYMSVARKQGWIVDEGEKRFVTDDGIAALGDYEPLPSGSGLLNYWLGDLGNSGAARILTALAQAYPEGLTNEQLGEAAGMSSGSGSFGTYMSKLRTLELIQSAGRGLSKASDELFD